MDIQLTAGFGNIQVILKKFIDRCQCFIIEIVHCQTMQHFLDKHTAERQGQLINQPANAQLFIIDNKFFRFKNLSDLGPKTRLRTPPKR